MESDTPEPLWREVVGDTEPWRRGRLFLVLLAAAKFLIQLFLIGSQLLAGNLELVIYLMVGAILFWLAFYFIWIGVHWVRWLAGGWSCLFGFAQLIWGVRDGSVLLLVDGTIGFAAGAYLALAPSVYFFAQHQRARSRGLENLIVAAVMFILLASCAVSAVGFWAYRSAREAEGRKFANQAFRQIFADHDQDYLINHATARTLQRDGKLRWQVMMTNLYMRCGRVHDLQPARGWMRCRLRWPATLVTEGRMFAEGIGDGGPLPLQLDLGEAGGEWQIDGVWWRYPER